MERPTCDFHNSGERAVPSHRTMKALVVHSGGPSPVINASLVGLLDEARRHRDVTGMYGAAFGIEGIRQQNLIDLYAQSPETIQAIATMPSSALGTSRKDLAEGEIDQLLQVCRSRDIGQLFITGGNGSLGMADR